MNYDIELANRDNGNWVRGECLHRLEPCKNPYCMDQAMRSKKIYGSTKPGSDYGLEHARKIAKKCHENRENCPFGGLEDTLEVIKKISGRDIN